MNMRSFIRRAGDVFYVVGMAALIINAVVGVASLVCLTVLWILATR